MMAVIFEVTPAPGQRGVYLDAAAALKPMLAQIDGVVSIERFESLSALGKLLSLSFLRDEEAVAGASMRRTAAHRRQGATMCLPTTDCAWRLLCVTMVCTAGRRRLPIPARRMAERAQFL